MTDTPKAVPDTDLVRRAVDRLATAVAAFDDEVADVMPLESERADLWTDIDVPVGDVRTVLTALTAYQQRVDALEGERDAKRVTLATQAWRMLSIVKAITDGIKTHGSYSVPWSVLSWPKDAAALAAEAIEEITGPICRECDGRGIVDNPEARYERSRETGFMETNDIEEIDCPRCGGDGLEPRMAPGIPAEEEIAF